MCGSRQGRCHMSRELDRFPVLFCRGREGEFEMQTATPESEEDGLRKGELFVKTHTQLASLPDRRRSESKRDANSTWELGRLAAGARRIEDRELVGSGRWCNGAGTVRWTGQTSGRMLLKRRDEGAQMHFPSNSGPRAANRKGRRRVVSFGEFGVYGKEMGRGSGQRGSI
jgi:hypothetical protein